MRTLLAVLLTCLALTAHTPAGERAVLLTLNDAIDLALKEGYEARSLALQLRQAEQNMAAARGRARTSVNLYLEAPNFDEGVQDIRLPDELPRYNTTGRLEWRGRLQVVQPLPTDGRLTLSSDLRQRRESVFQDQLDTTEKGKSFLSSLRVSLQQPLFVPNALKLDLEQAGLRLERAQRQFTRTQLNLVYSVTQEFYNVYRATRRLEIAGEEAKHAEQSYELAQKKFKAGLIPEVEALQMEVDLAQSRNSLLEAEGNLSRAMDQFRLTVGLRLEDEVAVRTDFSLTVFEVDSVRAVEHGLRHHAEIRENEISRRLAEISLRETDARTALRGDVTAYYDRTGVSDPFLPYDTGVGDLFESSWDDLHRRPRNLGVHFTLTLPIWDSGANRAEVGAARAFLEQRELDAEESRRRVAQQVRSAITRLRETRGRLNVLKKSEDVAQRSYEISLARFDNGDITVQELALDRTRLTQARLAYLDAYIQYQLAAADLKRQTLYDFEKGRSLVGESG